MKQKIMYRYLGTNGTIDSPVFLEGIYSVKYITLIADEGKVLTKDGKHFEKVVRLNGDADIAEWKEVKDKSK